MELCCAGGGASSAKLQDTVVVMDGSTDAASALIAARAGQPDLSVNPVYQDFVEKHETNVRIHVHLVGLVSTQEGHTSALGKRRNRFGRPRVLDAIADPYVIVEALEKQGTAEYFAIASHTFPVIEDCQIPTWDAKCILIVPKNALQQGIRFTLKDKNSKADEVLCTMDVPGSELPAVTAVTDSSWEHYVKTPQNLQDSRIQHAALEFSIMITDCSDRIVSPHDMEIAYSSENNDGYVYSQVILRDESSSSNSHAVLQCWKHPNSTKAVLWILGRNDCFMHPHVARPLFWSQGYDLFVLNYKMNGICRKSGFVADPHFNSHNFKGDFDVYISDIDQALDHILLQREYQVMLGYAHSTGGPVLLNYLMEKGDDAFDGFLFNSPFLDWGFVGGDLVELVLENTGFLERLGAMNLDSKVGVAVTPEGTTPLKYLGQDIVLSDWSARLWSLYYFDWASRPLYKVPMTVGFAMGVTGVHRKMETWHKQKRPVTAKPFLVITSRGDDVLKAPETLSRADWIGPGRWEIELNDNGHDVFLSYDKSDTDMAIQMCLTWMKNRKFAE